MVKLLEGRLCFLNALASSIFYELLNFSRGQFCRVCPCMATMLDQFGLRLLMRSSGTLTAVAGHLTLNRHASDR
jgi:hypothetical protein